MAFTVKDIANLTGVSTATVSRVLNGKPGVKPETRQRIVDLIKEVDYMPDFAARSMKTGKTFTIGMVVADITNPFYSEAAKTIEFQARKHNYTLILGNTGNSTEEEQTIITAFQERHVDGFIIASSEMRDKKVQNVIRAGYPTILLHRKLEQDNVNYICCNEKAGVQLAMTHLHELGHRRISFISGPRQFSTGAERLKAFLKMSDTLGIEKGAFLIKEGGYNEQKTIQAVHELLALPEPPTAIFAANDFMAMQVLDIVLERGMRVPEDISVMGFDDIPLASHNSIRLTTIDVKIHSGAITAIEKLINLIDGIDPVNGPIQILLEPELKVRSSTGPPSR
ncbi:MAG: LacI family DNA-binding transcriptional regulator [Spirochaetota bacterium]|nr:LacI family DNA-binding transcriptional regulator [Spirochaetota bacterium]